MIGFMIYCAGLVGGIVGACWVNDLIENSRKNSWQNRVTIEDLEALGRLFDSEK